MSLIQALSSLGLLAFAAIVIAFGVRKHLPMPARITIGIMGIGFLAAALAFFAAAITGELTKNADAEIVEVWMDPWVWAVFVGALWAHWRLPDITKEAAERRESELKEKESEPIDPALLKQATRNTRENDAKCPNAFEGAGCGRYNRAYKPGVVRCSRCNQPYLVVDPT